MRKWIPLFAVTALVVVTLGFGSAPAPSKGKKVVYTASAAALGMTQVFGQSTGSGMVMFDDGTMKGMVVVSSISPSLGQVIFHYQPLRWVETVPGEQLLLTFEMRWIKGSAPYPPILEIPVPVTGGPTFIDNDGDGRNDFMLRVTPVR